MIEFLHGYWYLMCGLDGFAICVAVVAFRKERAEGSRSLFDYLLLWPILLDQYQKQSTKRSLWFVIFGCVIMVLLVIYGSVTGTRRGG
jgi:hypothetical protein